MARGKITTGLPSNASARTTLYNALVSHSDSSAGTLFDVSLFELIQERSQER